MCLSMHLYESNDRWSSISNLAASISQENNPQLLGNLKVQVVKRHKLHEDKIGHGPPKLLTRFSKKQVTCYSVLWRQNRYEIFVQYPLCKTWWNQNKVILGKRKNRHTTPCRQANRQIPFLPIWKESQCHCKSFLISSMKSIYPLMQTNNNN